ncbi:MAG TPA: DUF1592 domain-containing protein, partial [Polyangiaceae bacterium]|nr:DUF1592 domain-containing protein [Polyangiaceae bacterium]
MALSCQAGSGGGPEDVSVLTPLPDPSASSSAMTSTVPLSGTPDCGRVAPGAAEARLLTRLQYDNTVRDLLGDLNVPARNFPDENTFLGFSNNADAHRETLLLAEQHLSAAEDLAQAAVARGLDQLLPCDAGDQSEGCVSKFITQFGYRAFRRPLLDDESGAMLDLWRTANGSYGFSSAIELLLQVFLQSPQFLYRPESERVEGQPALGSPVQLDSYQIASRLSYFLWNTMPDAELFGLADDGKLSDLDTVRAQAERMLDDPRAQTTIADFYTQWLGMSAFGGITREVPGMGATNALNASWQESLNRFVQHTFWDEGGDLTSLLTSQTVFVDASLGQLYGFQVADDFTPVTDSNRSGLLTQPGLMALYAHADQSAPVPRGKFVREQVLCHPLPPPPPNVDTTPPDPSPNATTRERFKEHSADPVCGSCHNLIEGVGFG